VRHLALDCRIMTNTALLVTTFATAIALGACGPSSSGAASDATPNQADAGSTANDAAPMTAACSPIPDTMPTVCSMNQPARNAVFTNNCAVPVDIWWVTYTCAETFYRRLDPGMSYTQPSFVSHPWRARTAPAGAPMGTVKGMLIKDFGPIPAGSADQAFAVP
jgi:hypothetical protein